MASKVAYFSREDFDDAIKEIASFFHKFFPNYFTQISIRNNIVNFIKHCPNVYCSGGFSMGICRKIQACVKNISINGVETTFDIKGDYLVSGVVNNRAPDFLHNLTRIGWELQSWHRTGCTDLETSSSHEIIGVHLSVFTQAVKLLSLYTYPEFEVVLFCGAIEMER